MPKTARERKPDKQQQKNQNRKELHTGETVLVVARPARSASTLKYLYTLGFYGPWRKRHTTIVTDRRILLGKGIVSRRERSIPYRDVEQTVYSRRGFYAYSEISYTVGGRRVRERVGPLTIRTARQITREIQTRT